MDHRAQQQYSKSHQRQPHQQHQQQQPRQDLYVRDSSFDSHSTDRDDDEEEEEDYEISFLEACLECDDDALYEIIRDGVTREQINERDKSGRTGLSHASANGFIPILELLGSLEDLDPNLADNDGNTPLIYAAQAGHDDVVNYLLQNMRNVRVDQCNKMGFTALMKAAIQGRTRCAKLLLFAGASPNRRDHGRGLCAEEWARFCGCHSCANSIAKYVRSKKYFFKKTFLLSKDKWSSEPDMFNCSKRGGTGSAEKPTSWIQRHLSLKKKKGRGQSSNKNLSSLETGPTSESLSAVNKFGSAPILLINSYDEEIDQPAKNFRRPSCIDNVVQVSIGRRRQAHPPDDPDCGDRARGLVRNSSPGMNAMNHADSVEAQRHKDRDQLDRPPTITVGDLLNEENVCATPTAKASASDIIATSLGVRLPGKASADPLQHRATSGQEDSLKSPEAQQLASMSIKDFR